ncbi:hypothetical protein VP01_3458g2 [Puccinia sorghi]|uniref:Uncharacterized protein n=1 Tax=Puccinia sorghi TaxID=27349 RepID=A0A0L6UW83_9BASI|nr:hypothetical protein VP01_3458g2 [Puccinia sorghi]
MGGGGCLNFVCMGWCQWFDDCCHIFKRCSAVSLAGTYKRVYLTVIQGSVSLNFRHLLVSLTFRQQLGEVRWWVMSQAELVGRIMHKCGLFQYKKHQKTSGVLILLIVLAVAHDTQNSWFKSCSFCFGWQEIRLNTQLVTVIYSVVENQADDHWPESDYITLITIKFQILLLVRCIGSYFRLEERRLGAHLKYFCNLCKGRANLDVLKNKNTSSHQILKQWFELEKTKESAGMVLPCPEEERPKWRSKGHTSVLVSDLELQELANIVDFFNNGGRSESKVLSTGLVANLLQDEMDLREKEESDKAKTNENGTLELTNNDSRNGLECSLMVHFVAIWIATCITSLPAPSIKNSVPWWTFLEVCDILNMELKERLNVFDKKCYSLSLGNLLSLIFWVFICLSIVACTDCGSCGSQHIFRAFFWLRRLTFAFASQNKQTSIDGGESVGGLGGQGLFWRALQGERQAGRVPGGPEVAQRGA